MPRVAFMICFALGCFGWMTSPGLSTAMGMSPPQDETDKGTELESTEADEQTRLRGSITEGRSWWDLLHYDLHVTVDPKEQTIHGTNRVRFKVLRPHTTMQLDLQSPLAISKVEMHGKPLAFERKGNAWLIAIPNDLKEANTEVVSVTFGGTPVESKRPPWSGGFSWTKDSSGKDFIATSCQGIGASIWWPCKDHGYDEPDEGADIALTVPEDLTAVANGRLVDQTANEEAGTRTFHWRVTNPINNYSINANIGDYVQFQDEIEGENGLLDMQYWVLRNHRETAVKHFKEAPRTIRAFEHWFGPYPFYEDSYKLVEVPYLGMEHQSAVTYGNGFKNGYRGTDLSETGVGMKFDFIVVHESGHEWFGNNISMKDAADMWIHESFTNYSENLFVEYHFTRQEAEDYVIGCRKRVKNDIPIIGVYDRNQAGSGDMYYKGGNMLHTLRHMINDTEKWRSILRGLNEKFWHQTVTTEQIENYLAERSGLDLEPFFDQYLRSTDIPVFEYQNNGKKLEFRFSDVVDDFTMPMRIVVNDRELEITASSKWQSLDSEEVIESFKVDRNFYVETRQIEEPVE